MTKSERTERLELYSSGPELLEKCLANVPDDAVDYKPGPERWSIQQIVIHIVDSDVNGFMRLRKPLAEPGDQVPIYNQEQWANRLHADGIPIQIALALFRAYRSYNEAYFAAVADPEWSQTVSHPERGPMSLDDALNLYAHHPTWHIDHISRTLAVWRRAQAGEQIDPDESLWVPPR